MNTTGYLNNSPHRFNKSNTIPGGDITMQGVDIPLLLRPNKGKSRIVMPNSGEYKFPGADYVQETPLASYQTGSPECPNGYTWDEFIQQCVPSAQSGFDKFSFKTNEPINRQAVAQPTDNPNMTSQSNSMEMKRVFGTPNIPAIASTNLLGFGLATFANNIEQGRQKAFMMKNMNNPLFNGSYSNAQNDYGVDPYEQTGQLRPQFKEGGQLPKYQRAGIVVTNPNDPRLRAYNDSLTLYNSTKGDINKLKSMSLPDWYEYTANWNSKNPNAQKAFNRLTALNKKAPTGQWFTKDTKGGSSAVEYKKPVQPVVYQKQQPNGTNTPNAQGQRLVKKQEFIEQPPKFKPAINPRFQGADLSLGQQPTASGQPAITAQPYDFKKPTKYVFTNANEKYLDQQNTYFPNEEMLRAFAADQKTSSITATKDGATATGYLKLQQGGKFDPVSYLYGDDDEKEVAKKEEKQAKKKRITDEDVEQQDAGFTDEDVLNMNSPVRSQRMRMNYQSEGSTEYAGADNFAMMYLKHQQGPAGAKAIQKAAEQGLTEVPRSWNKENIQAHMQNNVGKDFKGPVTPASFINYWAGKVNRHMEKASKTQTPYDEIFQKIGQEQGVDPLFLKTVANIESGLNPNNNTKSKYKGLFAQNSNTFKGNIFDPEQATRAAAQNFRKFEEGGEFTVDFKTMQELQAKGIKFKLL